MSVRREQIEGNRGEGQQRRREPMDAFRSAWPGQECAKEAPKANAIRVDTVTSTMRPGQRIPDHVVDTGRKAGDRNSQSRSGPCPRDSGRYCFQSRLIEAKPLVVGLDDIVHRLRARPTDSNRLQHLLAHRIDRRHPGHRKIDRRRSPDDHQKRWQAGQSDIGLA